MPTTESGRAYNDPREIRRRQQEAKRVVEQQATSEQAEAATPVQDVTPLPEQPEAVVDPVAQQPVADNASGESAPENAVEQEPADKPDDTGTTQPTQADLPIETVESPASADATGDQDHLDTHDLRQQQEEEPKP
jgi:ribonuclease E